MLIKVLILSLILIIHVETQADKILWRRQRAIIDSSLVSDFIKSLYRFENKVRNFFRFTITNIETGQQKNKKSRLIFLDEGYHAEENSKNETLMRAPSVTFEEPITAIQMILHHGYQVECHSVQTRDGYILRLHRVLPHFVSSLSRNSKVILHHGLMGSSDDWLLLGASKSLPYLLTEAGYDVWLTNARGSKYSRVSDNSSKFWNFSFHEIGTLDLPAVIDYVKYNSKSDSKIDFVGFSMGATALLVLLSSHPQYNQVLNSATLLAPLAFMYQIKGPLKLLAKAFREEKTLNFMNILGINEFMRIEMFPSKIIKKYCRGDRRLCRNPLLLMANGGKKIADENVLENVLGHLPGGASMKTIMHLVQLVNSGQFQMYDYGTLTNLEKYGMKFPPGYKLANVKLPIVLFSSADDWLSTNECILRLLHLLPHAVHHMIWQEDFSHTDFVWGESAPSSLFNIIIEMLDQLKESEAVK